VNFAGFLCFVSARFFAKYEKFLPSCATNHNAAPTKMQYHINYDTQQYCRGGNLPPGLRKICNSQCPQMRAVWDFLKNFLDIFLGLWYYVTRHMSVDVEAFNHQKSLRDSKAPEVSRGLCA